MLPEVRFKQLLPFPSIPCLLLGVACSALTGSADDHTWLGIGEPCVVAHESFPTFGGFSPSEVNIEADGSCGMSNVCLVHDFQGRATCPAGQADADVGACQTPGGEPVVVPVEPQLSDRPAERAMICSCRCDGPDPDATYCPCPTGMRCEELIHPLRNHQFDAFAGSYCVYE